MWLALFIRSRGRKDRSAGLPSFLPDEEILLRYTKDGDQAWIGVLYDRYLHLVYGVCLKYLSHRENARDATMEIFEKLFEDLKVHEVKNFRSWLYMVSKNHCLMKLRSRKTTTGIDGHEKDLSVVEFEEFLHLTRAEEKEQKLEKLEKAINGLKQEQQQCIRLFYLENRSYREVSKLTGFSMNEVKSHVQNGKRNLKNLLESSP